MTGLFLWAQYPQGSPTLKLGVRIPSPLKVELYPIVWIEHIVFIHLSADGLLSWSHLLAFWIWVYKCLCLCFQFLRLYTQKWNCWICFKFFEKFLYHSGCFILFSLQQCPRAVISPYPHQLLLFCFSDSNLSDVCEVIISEFYLHSLVMWFANIFPPIFGLPFTLPVVSLMCRRFKLWYVFSFVACAFGVISKK